MNEVAAANAPVKKAPAAKRAPSEVPPAKKAGTKAPAKKAAAAKPARSGTTPDKRGGEAAGVPPE
ncbi:hypothetical protein [Rhodococcus opacus]|uniref:hypothetical protein n=1 Tax=Rhodococcus opacus TaxID=37919 RepID=UPI001650E8DA|nr:hypothetical protein [Rhodococcus opacus]